MLSFNLAFSQEGFKVAGKVTQSSGEPLAGATVTQKGTATSTVTKDDGSFSINVANKNVTLVVSYVGYSDKQIKVNGQQQLSISLENTNSNLNDIVVIGYGTVRRKELTGSVASIGGKALAATPVNNIAQAMQGKMAGVNIVSQDGRPNADISIRIRGGGSISGSNQPLILIDGIQGNLSDIPADQVKSIDVLKEASATAIYGARGANGVVVVTTKGAQSGKAVVSYNGYVKFNTAPKYMEALKPYDYLRYVWANAAANGAAYSLPFEKLYGLGANAGSNTGGIESYRNLSSDDMQKLVYNSSTSHNHDLTLTGGTEKTKMFFSTNYTDEQGMKLNSSQRRGSVSFKVVQKVADNLTFGVDTRYTDNRSVGDEGLTTGNGSILSYSYRFRPIATNHILGDRNAIRTGNIEQYGKNTMWDNYSPVSRISDFDPVNINQSIRGIATVDWGILKGLNFHSDITVSKTWSQKKYWTGAIYNNYVDDAANVSRWAGAVDYGKNDSWLMRWSNTLNYEFNIGDNSKLNVLGGAELTSTGGTTMSIQANHFPSNYTEKTAFAQINQYDAVNGSSTFATGVDFPYHILSYFGRINYSLLDRYLFTTTFRQDGSSKLAPLNHWGSFPAFAVAWRMTEEQFMKSITWLKDLKLRASYGAVGNDAIPFGRYAQTWGSTTDQRNQYAINHIRQSSYDLNPSTLANPTLKWETTITRTIGTDFDLFDSRLTGTIDVYKNTTKNLLSFTSIPSISGFTGTYANVGQTSNKGIEISLSGVIFENKNWNITATGNINFNKNNIDELAPNVTGLYGTSWAGSSSYPANDYILQVGSPVGLVRGLTYEGFYTTADFDYSNGLYTLKKGVADLGSYMSVVHGVTATDRPSTQRAYPGLPKYKDLNGDKIIDDKDISVIGNMNAVHTGGFNLSATYKSIDFGLFFNWSYGNKIYNANLLATMFGSKEAGVYENKLAIMNDAYKIYDVVNGQLVRLKTPDELNAANVNAKVPLAYAETGPVSTKGIENGSYLRLNTLNLGYSLPKSLISKVRISNLRIYGSIYNLFTLTGYSGLDPEVNANPGINNTIFPTVGLDYGTYPRARSFVVGMNLRF